MQELWAHKTMKPEWRIWIATREDVCSEMDLRLFALWCATRMPIAGEYGKKVVIMTLRWLLGKCTDVELMGARKALADSLEGTYASRWAIYSVGWVDAGGYVSARVAAFDAATYAANDAASGYDPNSARTKQVAQLIKLVGNPFKQTNPKKA